MASSDSRSNDAQALYINGSRVDWYDLRPPFVVNSFPYPYKVRLARNPLAYASIVTSADFVIIDKNVRLLYPVDIELSDHLFEIQAAEDIKNLTTVSCIIEAMINLGISKGSRVLAIGGGILQDLSACACALYRRGQPFTYMPTTTLGQLDSCVGAKCAINTQTAKNILGLFSAPREIIVPAFMVRTMPLVDHRAGLAEMLRLCLTASNQALDDYRTLQAHIQTPSSLDLPAYEKAIALSLSIKKAVIEYDEYEKDVRRSMNYGHTFGHAIEKVSSYQIPHGLAVLVGMHIANLYSHALGLMSSSCLDGLIPAFAATAKGVELPLFDVSRLDPALIVKQFAYDKKGDGKGVPLVLLKEPGTMIFKSHLFSDASQTLHEAITKGLTDFRSWISAP